MAAVLELARVLGLAALVLSFAIIAARRAQAMAHLAQLAAVALAAVCQAGLQRDATLLLVAATLAAQGALLWADPPAQASRTGFPVVALGAALLLVVLATAIAPTDASISAASSAMGVPLAIVLLGLLASVAVPGPYGLLSLVNGVTLGMIVAPGLPLRPVLALGLCAAALFVARDGPVALRWVRR